MLQSTRQYFTHTLTHKHTETRVFEKIGLAPATAALNQTTASLLQCLKVSFICTHTPPVTHHTHITTCTPTTHLCFHIQLQTTYTLTHLHAGRLLISCINPLTWQKLSQQCRCAHNTNQQPSVLQWIIALRGVVLWYWCICVVSGNTSHVAHRVIVR